MKKGLTELVFILDRSGSMAGLESDTIGGFNSMMEKQRQEPGEACVTTVLFDDQYEVVHDRLSADCVEPMTGASITSEDVRPCWMLWEGRLLILQMW